MLTFDEALDRRGESARNEEHDGRAHLEARQLLAVAALAALGEDRQLASHARGAVRCGAILAEVLAALECLRGLVPDERVEAARRVVERFAAT